MSLCLTREELYDLVWSKPMIHVAKGFGISDVMLGKICRDLNVPRPPRGYWASLQANSNSKRERFVKPQLPNLIEADGSFNNMILKEYEDREAARTDIFDPHDLDDPIKDPPPPFTESLTEFRERIEARFPVLVAPEGISSNHVIVQKLLDYDAFLAANRRRDSWVDKPQFQDEKGRLYLRWLNVLVNSFEALGFDVIMRGRKHFTFHATVLGHHKEFLIFISDQNSMHAQRKPSNKANAKTYCFRWVNDSHEYPGRSTYYEFETLTVDCIKTIVMDIVMRDEKDYRGRVVKGYANSLESRKWAIRNHELQIQRAAERKQKEYESLLASRLELMNTAVSGMKQADQIRDLIATIQAKSESAKQPVEDLKHWVGWATHLANTIDPRHMSVEGMDAWISKFKLKH